MTMVTPTEPQATEPRHARLFELIRQKNLAVHNAHKAAVSRPADAPRHTLRQFATSARKSLTPQEQQALGISSSFGR